MPFLRPLGPVLLLAALVALSACKGKEERAEEHYQRALEFVASGDAERAKIEFRNVFRLNGEHTQARLAFARLLRDEGDVERALSHYLLLAEQDRNSIEGQRELAALALSAGDLGAAEAAVRRAFTLAPDDPEVRGLKATLDYREGSDRPAALAMAEGVLAEAPGNVPANMVLIADRMNAEDPQGALVRADAAIAALEAAGADPDPGLHLARLAALEATGDDAAVGLQLTRMAGLFPDDAAIGRALVQWRVAQGDLAGAEAALRAAAARAPADPGPALVVAQFLYETGGAEAAAAELDRLIAGAAAPLPFQRARAGLDFAEGRRDAAVAALRGLVDGAPPSDAVRDTQIELASMLEAMGDAAGRDALIAAALEGDARHVGALKLRARARIAADQPELAIQDMRAALTQAPRDPEIMTILAAAHEREGARELAGERLALAVEVSGRAPAESLRYARFLMQDGRLGPAEGVVVDALRAAPADPDLLAALGEIHVARRDWRRAEQVERILRGLGDPAAADMAAGIEMARLEGEGRSAETLELLESLAADGGNAAAAARLMQAHVAAGDLDAAQAYLDDRLAAEPASRPLRLMQAGLMAARGDAAGAEALYAALIAEDPAEAAPHRARVALLAAAGETARAEAALEAGIAATGGDPDLVFLEAGLLESRGDFEGAIAAYETLYARDTSNPLIANNLASLITTHRADPASLERAFAIARRLRVSDVPHFRDTYGWILHRRGDSEGALAFLEPAAEALPDNPLVQYHAGEALLAAGRPAEARARFAAAAALAEGAAEPVLPQIEAARARIAEIDAAAPAPAPAPADQASSDG